jgi:phosphatidylglycerol lysyltransferase
MEIEKKLKYLKKYANNPLSYLSISNNINSLEDKEDNFEGFIPYKKINNTIIILGDPLVNKNDLNKTFTYLKNLFEDQGISVCLFSCSESIVPILKKNNFKGVSIGKNAVTNLSTFSIKGGKKWNIRSSINYAKKHGYEIEEYCPSICHSRHMEEKIRDISNQWCQIKKIPKPRFIIGKLNFESGQGQRFFVCKIDGRIVGYVNYYPVFGSNSYYLDHTRRINKCPRGVMDFLLVNSFRQFRSEGVSKIYLGLSPFSIGDFQSDNLSGLEKIFFHFGKYLLSFFYPIESEFFFKKKYATNWEPNYCFFYPRLSFRLFLSLANVFYDGGIPNLVYHKIKNTIIH